MRARFGRTLGRKVAAPILLIGSIAGFCGNRSGILNGQVKGPAWSQPIWVRTVCITRQVLPG